jgi:hypothetical protein
LAIIIHHFANFSQPWGSLGSSNSNSCACFTSSFGIQDGRPGARCRLPPSPISAPVLPSRVAELIRAAKETDPVLENGERDIGAWQKKESFEAERGRVAERASAARELSKKNQLNEKRESQNKAIDPSLASPNPSSASPHLAPLASPSKKTVDRPKRSSARIGAAKHNIQKNTKQNAVEMPAGCMLGEIWGELENIVEFAPDATAGGLEETTQFAPFDDLWCHRAQSSCDIRQLA